MAGLHARDLPGAIQLLEALSNGRESIDILLAHLRELQELHLRVEYSQAMHRPPPSGKSAVTPPASPPPEAQDLQPQRKCSTPTLAEKVAAVMFNLGLPAEGTLAAQVKAASAQVELQSSAGSLLEQVDELMQVTGITMHAPSMSTHAVAGGA